MLEDSCKAVYQLKAVIVATRP